MDHSKYLKRCIQLARLAMGKTFPNPLVGCVIVHNNKIIGEGYHKKAGEPHAEINAIESVKDKSLLKNSTIYVSLEPCSHYGKTPPCALKIIEIGFKNVVIGSTDPHDKVNGKGIQIIQNENIKVIPSILKQECDKLNKRFFTLHKKRRPFIVLKWAETNNGYIDANYKSVKISNQLSSQYVHLLRSEEHAIMVGTQTAIGDNPTLTTRKISGRNPIRVLIDMDLKVPKNYNVFNDEARTIIFNKKITRKENNIEYIQIENKSIVTSILHELYKLEIQSVLVEGGAKTLNYFIKNNLWDEAIIITNKSMNVEIGTKAPVFNFSSNRKIQINSNIISYYTNWL